MAATKNNAKTNTDATPAVPRRPHYLDSHRYFDEPMCRAQQFVVERCLQILADDNFDFGRVALFLADSDWINKQLLQQVNSAQLALGKSVTDTRHAAAIMGQTRLNELLRRLQSQLLQRIKVLESKAQSREVTAN